MGPVFPIRADFARYREPPRGKTEEPSPSPGALLPGDPGSEAGLSPAVSQELFPEAGVKDDPELVIGLSKWKPVTVGNNWAARPWEVWVYASVGKGLEVAFTDEFNTGIYDYAPIPGLDEEDLKRLDGDRYQGQTAYVRLVQRLTELAPSSRMARVSQEEPERYDISRFEPLDFCYDVVSFRGQNGLTDIQVNIGIPIDRVALSGEVDTTVVVERRVALMNNPYTRLLPAQRDLEAPISERTRGQAVLDRVDLGAPPGDYALAVQVGRRNTNRLQSYEQRLTLPNYAGDALALSDLFVAKQVTPAEDTTGVLFLRDRWRITPLPSHVFRAGQHVVVYFEIYNLSKNTSGHTRYEVSYRVRATGLEGVSKPPSLTKIAGQSEETVSVRYERTGMQELVSDYVELDVGKAESGRYEVGMTVKDLHRRQAASKEVIFWIAD
jgi:hypothetical protein